MHVTIRQLEAFTAVARTGNFTRAAEQLHVTQPVISTLIRDLEQILGLQLFDRSTRKVELTEAAAEFLDDAQRLTHGIEEAVRRATDVGARRRGLLRVGAPPLLAAALLPRVMRAFRDSFPGVVVHLVDRPVQVIQSMLHRNELHLAIGTFGQADTDIVRIPLVSDELALICRIDHPLAMHERPSWQDLADLPLITLHRGNGVREQLERGYASAGLTAHPTHEVQQLTTVISMVETGFGITVLPPYALSALRVREIVARPLGPKKIKREIEVAHCSDRSLPPAAADFINVLKLHAAQLQA